jgi:cell division protein FtsL
MKNINQLVQTYKQAPWRTQLQWIGLVLALLAFITLASVFYVNVNNRTTQAGRKIAESNDNIDNMQHAISDLRSKIAGLTSIEEMQKRASALGFIPANPEEFSYVYVPGYTPGTAVSLAPKAVPLDGPVILPEYTESLLDWFVNRGQP